MVVLMLLALRMGLFGPGRCAAQKWIGGGFLMELACQQGRGL